MIFPDGGQELPDLQYGNPFRTAVPFGGRTTQRLSSLPVERDCNPKRVYYTHATVEGCTFTFMRRVPEVPTTRLIGFPYF